MGKFTVDGTEYKVRIKYPSMVRSFAVVEGPNSGTAITGRKIRDILGTEIGYELEIEPDPMYPSEYDNLYAVLAQPVETHTFSMPFGQTQLEFSAYVISGSDRFDGKRSGYNRWTGLKIQLEPIEPQIGAV